MKAGLFIVGLLVGLVCGVGGLIYFGDGSSIAFTQKFYQDDKEDFVSVSGTLTGELDFPNNTCSMACYRELAQCWIACAQAIGGSQLGPVTPPFFHAIQSWTATDIVAVSSVSSGPLIACSRTTITIKRPTGKVLWVEEPVNQTEPICKDAQHTTSTSTIEDAPGRTATIGTTR